MKKKLLFLLVLFIIISLTYSYSLTVLLDLNQNTGSEPLDVNLSATVLDGTQSRVCTDNNDCGTQNDKPEEIQVCGTCVNGTTQNCITTESCPGIRTCIDNSWSSCIDVPNDGCPLIEINVIQVKPKENITITQNTPFTFTTKVTCLGGTCGNVNAILDPQISTKISQATDDAYVYPTSITQTIYNHIGRSTISYTTGLRFNNITIPKGSIINSASLELTSRDNESGNTVKVKITAQTGTNPLTFSTYAEFIARTKTASFVQWDNLTPWVLNQKYNSPDISTVIQEVINDPLWNSGNSIVIFIEDNGSSDNARRKIMAYESSTTSNAALNIDYTVDPENKGTMPVGAGNPFYTSSLNPQTCANMQKGDECINTWDVMPTGNIGNTYKFFVFYIPQDLTITQKITPIIRITIGAGESCSDNDGDTFNAYNPITCYSGTDCDDLNPAINPSATEICGNAIDDNCNGETDESCIACVEDWTCTPWSSCSNGVPPYVFEWDFEGNGIIDATTNSPNNWLVHTYNAGYYNPKVLVADKLNQKGENSKQLSVSLPGGNFPPIAEANGPYTMGIGTISLSSAGSTDDGSITVFAWTLTAIKGNPDCSLNDPNDPLPQITCNEIGTVQAELTVTDNQGATDKDSAEVKIIQSQTEDKINVVKMQAVSETVKEGNELQVIVRVRNVTASRQDFNVSYEVKPAEGSIMGAAIITGRKDNLELEAFSQKDFIITLNDLSALKKEENYWFYATATVLDETELNTTFNTRRITFSYKKELGQIHADETGIITIAAVLFSVMLILSKKVTANGF